MLSRQPSGRRPQLLVPGSCSLGTETLLGSRAISVLPVRSDSCNLPSSRSARHAERLSSPLRDIEHVALPYLLEVAVEGQLLLVAGLHFGSIPNDPDGLLEAVLKRLGRHGCAFMLYSAVWRMTPSLGWGKGVGSVETPKTLCRMKSLDKTCTQLVCPIAAQFDSIL